MNYSKQREEILDYVKSVKTHPTAETVYTKLRESIPNISLGTVYRNLDKLSEIGKLQRINLANEQDRFDGDTNFHYHAICQKCGEVSDIYIDYIKDIDKIIEKKADCIVISHDIIFNIICSKCK